MPGAKIRVDRRSSCERVREEGNFFSDQRSWVSSEPRTKLNMWVAGQEASWGWKASRDSPAQGVLQMENLILCPEKPRENL